MPSPVQLEMRRPDLEGLPPLDVPEGWALRSYLPGDEHAWARIMNDCIGQDWTAESCLEKLVRREEFRADGCFFAVSGEEAAGTATAWVKQELAPETGYVHMVGVAPAARGLGLGRLVSLATLHWFRDHGFRCAVLQTDDWRLPAIGTYLQLGFRPVLFDDEHAARWTAVRDELDRAAQERRSP